MKWLIKSMNLVDCMGVSINRGIPKIINFKRVFHYKPSIFGAHPYFWKHPYGCVQTPKRVRAFSHHHGDQDLWGNSQEFKVHTLYLRRSLSQGVLEYGTGAPSFSWVYFSCCVLKPPKKHKKIYVTYPYSPYSPYIS